MDLLDLAKKRYSVREYQSKPVEREKLQRILEAGWLAPTAANRQPHRIIVVQQEEGLQKVRKAARIYGAPLVLIICGDHSVSWKRHSDGLDAVQIDSSIVTDHMMLQATELGLGSVWICAFDPETIRKEFELPVNLEPVNILAIGYAATSKVADPDRHYSTRNPISEVVFYEKLK